MPCRGGVRACTPGRKRDVANRACTSLAHGVAEAVPEPAPEPASPPAPVAGAGAKRALGGVVRNWLASATPALTTAILYLQYTTMSRQCDCKHPRRHNERIVTDFTFRVCLKHTGNSNVGLVDNAEGIGL